MELEEESQKEYSALRQTNREQDNDTIWNFRIQIAIFYMDIMVREAIVQNVNNHMWMFYYANFIKSILGNMQFLTFSTSEENRFSRNFDLIELICMNMMSWKSVSVKSGNTSHISSIYNCIGQCIYQIAITPKLRLKDKHYLVNWIWEDIIKTFVEDEEILGSVIDNGFRIFKKPTVLFSSNKAAYNDDNIEYLNLLIHLWEERDTPKFANGLEDRVNRFKKEVIDEITPK